MDSYLKYGVFFNGSGLYVVGLGQVTRSLPYLIRISFIFILDSNLTPQHILPTMKKLVHFILAGIVLLGPVSCKKDDPAPAAPSLPTTAEAKAEHDTKSGGVYKGTFADASSSGTIKIVLQEGKTEATIVYNGVSRTLSTTDLAGWTSGEAISDALFTSSDWQLILTVTADASMIEFGLNLAGTSDFRGLIVKEVSAAPVKVYEGTYAGDSSGKWNFCTQFNLLAGVYTGTDGDSFNGLITGTTIAISSSGSSVTASGTLSADASSCSGNWTGSSGTSGTWTGTRKL